MYSGPLSTAVLCVCVCVCVCVCLRMHSYLLSAQFSLTPRLPYADCPSWLPLSALGSGLGPCPEAPGHRNTVRSSTDVSFLFMCVFVYVFVYTHLCVRW